MPYVMLFVLFVNGLTLDGSMNGIKYYVSPKWDRILDPEVCKNTHHTVCNKSRFRSLPLNFML